MLDLMDRCIDACVLCLLELTHAVHPVYQCQVGICRSPLADPMLAHMFLAGWKETRSLL